MRVLDGTLKNKRLRSIPSPKVKPTARRVRAALFELLGPRIAGASFLDLCAGSGAVGIEAISRGARHATFVDKSPKACDVISENLLTCALGQEVATIVESEALPFMRAATLTHKFTWNFIYFDPPYQTDYLPVLQALAKAPLMRRRALLIVEHHADNPLPAHIGSLVQFTSVQLRESALTIYKRSA